MCLFLKSDILSDIYDGIVSNKAKWDEIRKVLNKGEKNGR